MSRPCITSCPATRQGCGHRTWRDRTSGHILVVLWRSLPATASIRIRRNAAQADHQAQCAVLSRHTGWTGGGYGVGKRFPIAVTRALVNAALSGALAKVDMRKDENFEFSVPLAVEGVDARYLNPRDSWADSKAYDTAAEKLLGLFKENFKKFENPAQRMAARVTPAKRTRFGKARLTTSPSQPFLHHHFRRKDLLPTLTEPSDFDA